MSIDQQGRPGGLNPLQANQVDFFLPRQFLDFRLAPLRAAAVCLHFRVNDIHRLAAAKEPRAPG